MQSHFYSTVILFFTEMKKKTAKETRADQKARLSNVDYFNVLNRSSKLGTKDACSIAVDAVKLCKEILESLGPISTYDAIRILSKQLGILRKFCLFYIILKSLFLFYFGLVMFLLHTKKKFFKCRIYNL